MSERKDPKPEAPKSSDQKSSTKAAAETPSEAPASKTASPPTKAAETPKLKAPAPLPPGMAFERDMHAVETEIAELEEIASSTKLDLKTELDSRKKHLAELTATTYSNLEPWQRVNVARHQERPVAGDYIAGFDEFFELHGDKVFGDDAAIVAGFSRIEEQRFLLVGHRKGKTTKERLETNFGCAHPEGYRKALRKMQLAQKLKLPIVALINTPGAYPGIGAEERGQAAAIAENILAMFHLKVPILCIVIGEGGSGGALGIGVGDRVLMMEYSYYSVISPEGCAAILWKDGARTPDAAEALKLTAPDLQKLNLVDGVIEEPAGGAHRDPALAISRVRERILNELRDLGKVPIDELVRERRNRFRFVGKIEDRFPEPAAAY